jgi:CHAT domain-containing protein
MTKNQQQFEQFLDWVEGRLSAEEMQTAEAIYQSLSEEQKQDFAWYENLLAQIKGLSFVNTPAELRDAISDKFSKPQDQPNLIEQILATLTFNSRAGLGAAGVRSAAVEGQSQQLIFTTQQADVTHNIEPGSGAAKVYGQVFWNEDLDTADVLAQLVSEKGSNRLAAIDAFGEAQQQIGRAPEKARALADICISFAPIVETPILVPQARYLKAQAMALSGEFEPAVALIDEAHQEYLALGEQIPALRTNVGRMHVLNELGRHEDVIQTSQFIFLELDTIPEKLPPHHAIAILTYNNLGVCYRRMGSYEEALSAYAQGEQICEQAGLPDFLGQIRNNRGLILVNLGRVSEALSAFETAEAFYAETDAAVLQAHVLVNMGEAHLRLGNYTESLDTLSNAYTLLEENDAISNQHYILLHRADVYLALNLYPEALDAYKEAVQHYEQAGMTHYMGRAYWGLGVAEAALGKREAAAASLDKAAARFEHANNLPRLADVRLEKANLLYAAGQPGPALQMAQETLALVEGKWPTQEVYANLRLADYSENAPEEAGVFLNKARSVAANLTLPSLAFRIDQRFGHNALKQGHLAEARTFLDQAHSGMERLQGTLAQEALRISFLHDKTSLFEDLFLLTLAEDSPARIENAFNTAEKAKSRILIDMLSGVLERSSENAATDQVRALYADLNAVYNELLGGGSESSPIEANLPERASQLEKKIQKIQLESRTKLSQAVPRRQSSDYQQVRQSLGVERGLLSYQIVNQKIVAFVGTDSQLHYIEDLGDVAQVQGLLQKLHIQWSRFQAGAQFTEKHLAMMTLSTERILQSLYDLIIRPFAKLLAEHTQWVIVPHGILHQVPFHALYTGEQYLLDQFEISTAPSGTVFAHCQNSPPPSAAQAVLVGVSDELIVAAEQEAAELAEILPAPKIFLGESATRATMNENLAGASLIHMACHGLFRADNPMFSSLKLGDGWLSANEIIGHDLKHSLVVLSACESGKSKVMAGDEILGLVRAFLAAGTSSLIVSLWVVQDETTRTLMRSFYQKWLSGGCNSPSQALRSAQLEIKSQHAHPYYWAPFIFVGRP